jgi:hypothetical protein
VTGRVERAWSVAWPPLAVLASHAIVTALAGHQEWLDPLFHFSGGIAGAVALWRGADHVPMPRRWTAPPRRVALIMLAMLAVTLGWELVEFLSDRLRGTHIQLSPLDTWSDVALGLLGAAIAVRVMGRAAGAQGPPEPEATASSGPIAP